MGIVQDRMASVDSLLSEVKSHHMCLHFNEDKYYYTIQYPEGMRLDGVRIEKSNNKTNALEKLISAMNRHWDESGVTK